MSRKIGFEKNENEWEGPLTLEFKLDEKHASLRYKSHLLTQEIVYYPPAAFVGSKSLSDAPETIQLTFGRAVDRDWYSKFRSEVRPIENVTNYLIYEFEKEMGNSIQYIAGDIKGNNRLYLPNEMFKGEKYPKRVFVSVNLIT